VHQSVKENSFKEPKKNPKLDKNRVVVAMSGGVDSSVALLKIVEKGYETIGITMKLWDNRLNQSSFSSHMTCCSLDAINNAKLVCQSLGVPHYTLDYQDVFRDRVINNFVDEYFSGRTPNPCVRCNTHLRWGALLQQADLLSANWITTGHYARIVWKNPQQPTLKKGVYRKKDQSYVLWGIPRETLTRTLFPIGDLTKKEVRKLAKEANLVTADMTESQEICFVPDNDYRQFLKDYAPEQTSQEKTGDFVSEEGQILGKHRGLSHYTIGQRHGLGVFGREPLYVRDIDPEFIQITLSAKHNMFFNGCIIEKLNWLQDLDIKKDNIPVRILIRYNHDGVNCSLSSHDNGTITAKFESPQFAITPGQSAVFYSGDTLLGGGIITRGYIENESTSS